MYQLYIANKNYSSWSLRPWALMTQLEIPFNEQLSPFTAAPAEQFKRFSAAGKVPALYDDSLLVWDSLAIIEYLAEKHSDIWPKAVEARAWARSAAAEMHSGFNAIRNLCPMSCGVRVRLNSASATALAGDVARLDALWQQGLATFGGPFLAGDAFSAVDAFFAPVVFRQQTYGLALSSTSLAWCRRMRELPSLDSWYQAALAEPWREEGHEADVNAVGVITDDFRTPA